MVDALSLAGTRDNVRRQMRQFDGMYDMLILGAPFFGVSLEETQACHEGIAAATGAMQSLDRRSNVNVT